MGATVPIEGSSLGFMGFIGRAVVAACWVVRPVLVF